MNVRIKRLNENAVIPKYAREGDAGFDLVATEDVIIEPGEAGLVPTGLAFELPQGYELQIRPRSGVTLKTKLRVANAPGTIDSGFRGEVKVIIDNIAQKEFALEDCGGRNGDEWLSDLRLEVDEDYVIKSIDNGNFIAKGMHPVGTYIIRKGDRIAQGIIAPVTQASFVEVAELGESERGEGGFGSTGTKKEDE